MSASDQARPWVTVSSPSQGRLRFRRLRLVVVSGPDAGRKVEFADERVRVGGRRENELPLSDPLVSGLHLEIEATPLGVRLRDPGSTNGTWVLGLRVGEAYLKSGTEILVGSTVLRLEAGEDSTEVALGPDHFGLLCGESAPMRAIFARLARIAPADVPVLLTGETGTGKEIAARAIHEASPRAHEPFVAVECAAIPGTLIESELFGYERGAFTGAERSYAGAFERAASGTLLLDEVGELPLSVQPKLLRALDRMEVRRLGSDAVRPVGARIIAATNRDLARMVNEGSFRDDLYYRLAVAEVRLPPLRERREDIPLLVRRLLELTPGAARELDGTTLAALLGHSWPGNVRELRNAVQRVALVGEPAFSAARPPRASGTALPVPLDLPYKDARDQLLEQFRALYTRSLLDRTGSVSAAARLAQVDRMTFHRLLRRSESDREEPEEP
jgi:DNA-binding NtrC family response regulator